MAFDPPYYDKPTCTLWKKFGTARSFLDSLINTKTGIIDENAVRALDPSVSISNDSMLEILANLNVMSALMSRKLKHLSEAQRKGGSLHLSRRVS